MELRISDKKRKRVRRRFVPGVVLVFIGFTPVVPLYLAERAAPALSALTGVSSGSAHWIIIIILFLLQAAACFIPSYFFIKAAQKAKTLRVFLGDHIVYIVDIHIKTESSFGEYDVNGRECLRVTAVSPECAAAKGISAIKFSGDRLIRTRDLSTLLSRDKSQDWLENNPHWRTITENGFSDTLKSIKGKYISRFSIPRILERDAEEKLTTFFGNNQL